MPSQHTFLLFITRPSFALSSIPYNSEPIKHHICLTRPYHSPFLPNTTTPHHTTLRPPQERVSDGEWHVVRVTRRHRRLLLKVDNHRPVRGRAGGRGSARKMTNTHLWLGEIYSTPISG